MKTIFKKSISIALLCAVTTVVTFADVPIAPLPTQYVECLCVTSGAQTCVTQQGSGFLGGSLNSSCLNGGYAAVDASQGPGPGVSDPSRVFGNYSEMYRTIVGNGFTAGNGFFKLSGSPVYPVFAALQNCTLTFFPLGTTCTPTFPENLSAGSLGSNSSVPCKRANGITGTLHHTGYIVTVNAINTLPSGFGGITGGSVGTIISPPVVNHYNFSCY